VRSPGRLKLLFYAICFAPALWLIFLAFTSGLGANPVEKIIHTTGDWALNFLLLTLTITPLRRITGWSWPMELRRTAGLFCFFYAVIHFFTYIILYQGFSWEYIMDDVVKHKRIAVGFASLMFLVPPAVTSMASMARRLGWKRWRIMQSTVYGAAVCGVVHYVWLVKRDMRRPLIYAAILAVLLGYRLVAYALTHWITKEGKTNDRPIGMIAPE
jgi:sulfoxide reductase heme-binding subunit YedZ